MISMLRKEARSANIQDLDHIPTQNFLADCLTKADNLIIAVETGRLLEVDVHPKFQNTHGAQRLVVDLVQNIYAHKGEG